MNSRSKLKEMGRQQIMAAIVECTEKLGEVPSQPQLTKMTNFTKLQEEDILGPTRTHCGHANWKNPEVDGRYRWKLCFKIGRW